MSQAVGRPGTDIAEGTRTGLRVGLRKAFAEVAGEPLPDAHVDLLLSLRKREREQAERKTV